MSGTWLDSFTVALLALVAVLALVDFLLGERGRRKLQSRLETWWLQLSYVRLPTLGLAEAQSFVAFIDRVFGSRLLSLRRLVSTALLVTVLVCIAYIVLEASRVASGQPFRWPFTGGHLRNGWPMQVIPAMISISISRALVATCVRAVRGYRWGTPIFLLAIGFAGYLSAALVTSMAMGLMPLELMIRGYSSDALRLVTQFDVIEFEARTGTTYYLPLMYSSAMIGVALTQVALRDPLSSWGVFLGLALHNDMVRVWYDFFIAMGVGGIRILFAIVFLASWFLLPPLKWTSSLLLLRLAEAERGALTVIVAAGAFLAKLIQEVIKALSA